ncbi:MAG: PASTA domain-containing protein [Ruminococcus sp.]|nr:PASTA domain-containing protein [Ruminococcus sp.]
MKKGLFKSILSTVLILTFIASVALLAGCGGTAKVTVPDVVGMTYDEATQVIVDAGLQMDVQRERYSDNTPEGSIDAMITKAGTELDKESVVKVVGSLGEGVVVPNLGVLTGKEAENLVNKVGLNPVIVEEYSDDVEEGNVISYTDGGQTIPVGSDVTITVSKGPEK